MEQFEDKREVMEAADEVREAAGTLPENAEDLPEETADETDDTAIGVDVSQFNYSEEARKIRRQETHSRLDRQRGKNRKKRRGFLQHVHPLTLLFCAAAVALCVLTLMDYTRLTVLSDEISKKEKELSEMQKINQDLYAAEEARYDLDQVKEQAAKMGMAPMDAGQLEYVELDTEEIIHVVGSEKQETPAEGEDDFSEGEVQTEKGLRRLWQLLAR